MLKNFPQDIKFTKEWRPYQKKVLEEIEKHLGDKTLHIVAAPGSGKTVLGLEVVRRLNKPTLILAPTITIRDQWIDRFVTLFLNQEKVPEWISADVKKPGFITVSTYQGLYSAYSGLLEESEEDAESEEEEDYKRDKSRKELQIKNKVDVGLLLAKIGVKVLVLDEAHHLTNEWWKCLIDTKEKIGEVTVVALTATPPYDVSLSEWERYKELCGPIDAEITVPELVLDKNLCPHQDFVLVSFPTEKEKSVIDEFDKNVENFVAEIYNNKDFIAAIENHPYIKEPKRYKEEILANSDYSVTLASFLKKVNSKSLKDFLKELKLYPDEIPVFDLRRMSFLLTNCIFADEINFSNYKELINEIKEKLTTIGAIEKRKVYLYDNPKINKIINSSISKLESVVDIVKLECQALAEKLRMVILTDYIRKEFIFDEKDKELDRIGVATIFEKIRKENITGIKLGVLCGTLVIIPKDSVKQLLDIAKEMQISKENIKFTDLKKDGTYKIMEIKGQSKKIIVKLMTELFNAGGITVLVGTRSLLGEGWDAPSINSIILASFVGSFMLSNQMRGRAIRVYPKDPDKISNIWHLVCVEENKEAFSEDMNILSRRFRTFIGPSFKDNIITNGISRLDIGNPPFTKEKIANFNKTMIEHASDRSSTFNKWSQALSGKAKKMIEGVKIPKFSFLGNSTFFNFILYTIIQVICWVVFFITFAHVKILYNKFINILPIIEKQIKKHGYIILNKIKGFNVTNVEIISLILLILVAIIILLTLPKFLKSLLLFIRHINFKSSVKQVGAILLTSLIKRGIFKTKASKLKIKTDNIDDKNVFLYLEGASTYENSIFLDMFEEILEPIFEPRYVITNYNKFTYSVPSILAKNKEGAQLFHKLWNKKMPKMHLVFTGTNEGKNFLMFAKSICDKYHVELERFCMWR